MSGLHPVEEPAGTGRRQEGYERSWSSMGACRMPFAAYEWARGLTPGSFGHGAWEPRMHGSACRVRCSGKEMRSYSKLLSHYLRLVVRWPPTLKVLSQSFGIGPGLNSALPRQKNYSGSSMSS